MSGPPRRSVSLLEVSGVAKHFGGLTALAGVDITVDAGEIVGLIGPNGSGKTTLFHCIAGALVPDAGDIRLRGQSLVGVRPDGVCARGVGRTFQLVRVFPQLSAFDNVLAGQSHRAESVVAAFASASTSAVKARARALLQFMGLADHAATPASELSYGQQRLLELATVLMGEPDLLLLDEPTAGVNPVLIERLLARLREINERGTTIVLIEHNMEAVMGLSSRMYALALGGIIAEGTPETLRNDPAVLESYFGPPRPPALLRKGIAYVMQRSSLFPKMTIQENLELGAYVRETTDEVRTDIERVLALFPRLAERRRQRAEGLSGGERRMLEIGRGLLLRPRLLLLDEPTMGLAPLVMDLIFDKILEVRATGTTVVMVEQN